MADTNVDVIKVKAEFDASDAKRELESFAKTAKKATSDSVAAGKTDAFDAMGKSASTLEARLDKIVEGLDGVSTAISRVVAIAEGSSSATETRIKLERYLAKVAKDAEQAKADEARRSAAADAKAEEAARRRAEEEAKTSRIPGYYYDPSGGAALKGTEKTLDRIASKGTKATNVISKLLGKVKSVIMYRMIRSAIRMVTDSFREGIQNAYQWSKAVGGEFAQKMDMLSTASLYLKNSLGSLAAPLINAVAPAIDFVVDKFVDLLNVISQVIAFLTGASSWQKAIKYPKEYAAAANQAAGGAGKLAKAMTTILSIDELNPLNGDNGSGGGGGGGSGGALDYTSMFENAAFDNPLGEWLQSLNLEPLTEAFGNLKEALKKVADVAAGGLKWAWDNVLEPFGRWTIEQALPVVINSLATALNLLADVCAKLAPHLAPIWDNFLKPLMSFTGGAWLSTLQSLADVLDDIDKAINGEMSLSDALETIFKDATKAVEKLYFLGAGISALMNGDFKKAINYLGLILGISEEASGGSATHTSDGGMEFGGHSGKIAKIDVEGNLVGLVSDKLTAEQKKVPTTANLTKTTQTSLTEKAKTIAAIGNMVGVKKDKLTTTQRTISSIANFIQRTTNWKNDSNKPIFPSTANFTTRKTAWKNDANKPIWPSTANFISRLTNWKNDANKPVFPSTANFTKTSDGLTQGQKSFYTLANFNTMVNNLTRGQTSFYALANFTSVVDGLTNAQKTINGTLNIKTLKVQGQNYYAPDRALGGAFYNGEWHDIAQYATGGIPNHGSLYIAGEAGSELVGHIGGRTEVLNQSQIASTIAAATSMSNASQNSILSQLLAVAQQIYEGQGDVRAYIPAGEVVSGLQRGNRRDGRTLVPVGV